MAGLDRQVQDSLSAGIFRSVARHLIPPTGCYDLVNGLLDDDGLAYRRGGSQLIGPGALTNGLRSIWDGYLPVGARTVVASDSQFGVLAADDQSIIALGGPGTLAPGRAAQVGGLLYLPDGYVYGGSRVAGSASAGTVSVTSGSSEVVGSGTAFTARDAGTLFRQAGGDVFGVYAVGDDTHLTLDRAWDGSTQSGIAYSLGAVLPVSTAVPAGDFYAAVQRRLLVAKDDTVRFSDVDAPQTFQADNFWRVPKGARIVGVTDVGDQTLLLTTRGVWAITGMELDLVDDFGNPQQRMAQANADLLLWHESGLADWAGSLVVPAIDAVWLVPPVGAPVRVSQSITPLYLSYVRAGYRPGGAVVYQGHYMLPILGADFEVVDMLVCRLDRPVEVRGFGRVWPWTHLSGSGARAAALAVRVGATARSPRLLGASRLSDSKVTDCSTFFEPSAAVKNDHDATTHPWLLETRDYMPQGLSFATVARQRIGYEMRDAATDEPTMTAWGSIGEPELGATRWGESEWGEGLWTDPADFEFFTLDGEAPVSSGRRPWVWRVGKRTRYYRTRLQVSDPVAKLVIRSIELQILSSGLE